MYFAMTTRTRGKLQVRHSLPALRSMHANYLLFGNLRMTTRALDRIEPALVPAIIGADMAIETPHIAMRSLCKVCRIDLVALATGILIIGTGRLKNKQQAGNQDGEQFAHCSNPRSSFPTSSGSRTASCK